MPAPVLYSAFDVVPAPKGASTHITQFVAGLTRAGYPVTLITAGRDSLPEREVYHGAALWRSPDDGSENYLQRALAFGDYVLAHVRNAPPYAVAHFRNVWSGFPLAEERHRYGYRLVYEVNGLASVEMGYHFPGLRGSALLDKVQERELAALGMADVVICPSQVTRAYLVSLGVPPDRVVVIPNGVDGELFRPAPGVQHYDTPTILYVGTLADWQGLATLIEATSLVLSRQAVRLRILGQGRKRQRKALTRQIRKLGLEQQVILSGPVSHDQVPAAIGEAAVCVAPLGYNERNVVQGCCPIKILEYMACGRPIVAANLPVVRELVRPDRDALLFTPDDPADLARAIQAVLDDPALARRLGDNAATHVRAHFTWQAARHRLIAVYRERLQQDVPVAHASQPC